jgi:pyruvate dehydrogenase E2 component (dihydrolipoamide acetyltransferase)
MTTPILMPTIDSATPSARVMRWLRREGDFVEAGEPVAEIAAARATMDVEAPHAGVLIRILAEPDGHDIAVESVIGLIDSRAKGGAPEDPTQAEPGQEALGRAAPELVVRRLISPRARRLAHEFGLDFSGLSGSGPNGRIVENDVYAALAARALTQVRSEMRPNGPALAHAPPIAFSAPQLALSAPQIALEAEIRVDALESLRLRLNGPLADEAARVSLADCALKALALALQREPRAGLAHASRSDVALVVPVEGGTATTVFEAPETRTLAEIAAARAGFDATGLQGLQEASSLVIDFGSYGVLRAFPVLVAPFTTVLALGVAEQRVVVEDGVPNVARVMSVTLTFDRRAMDEAAGAALLATFRTVFENPAEMLS